MMKKIPTLLMALIVSSLTVGAEEPTDVLTWKSTDGRSIIGRATALEGEMVTIILTSNRTVKFSITKLDAMQQIFVKDHFGAREEEKSSENAEAVEETRSKRSGGKVEAEKVDSSEKSFYYYYMPSTAVKENAQPAIFYTGARAANEGDIKRFSFAANLTGMTIVVCGNSANRGSGIMSNAQHMKENIEHSMTKLNIDTKRLFFAGPSGGGQRCLQNATNFPCAGALPAVTYIGSTKPKKSGHYYVVGGAYDFNRYASARVAKILGRNAPHFLVPGGHGKTKEVHITDGVIWLYTSNMYQKGTANNVEREAFEDRFYDYLTDDLSAKPWKAYYWADHMVNTCKMSGVNKSKFKDLYAKLASDPTNVLYLDGMEELHKFSEKYLSSQSAGSLMKHTDEDVNKAAAKFEKKYGSIPYLKQIAQDLQQRTDSLR